MIIELKNQKLSADIDVQKEWPMMWHTENDKKVNDLSMSKGKIQFELAGDIKIDTGDLTAESILNFFKVKSELNDIHSKRYQDAIMRRISQE